MGLIIACVLGVIALAALSGFRKPQLSEYYRDSVRPDNAHWQRVRGLAMALSWGRDPLFPILRANQVHHLSYAHLGKSELPWIDVVPLNRRTHEIVTFLDRIGLRFLTRFVLRVAYLAWMLTPLYLFALVLRACGIAPWIPTPEAICGDVASGVSYLQHLVSDLVRSL